MLRRVTTNPLSMLLGLVSLIALLSACASSGTPTPALETEIVSYTFSPASPATLKHGEFVTAQLTYTSGYSGTIRMWAQIDYDGPITEGTLSFCPSAPVSAKQGVEERCFRVTNAFIDGVPATIHVDTIKLSIRGQGQTVDMYEEFVTVDYTWEP